MIKPSHIPSLPFFRISKQCDNKIVFFGSNFTYANSNYHPFISVTDLNPTRRGWDETFSQMKIGERRQIILPARLAYGDRGAGGIIPGGATLYFDVELLGIL